MTPTEPAAGPQEAGPTPYVLTRYVAGYTVVIDHGPCVKEAVGNLCVDCWCFLPRDHDWPDVTPAALRPPAAGGDGA